jgi:outer membrane protein assembly factor BamB
MTTTARILGGALLLALLLPAAEAHAVIPSAFGPIQALIVILPQLLLALAAGMLALFKPRTYKLLFLYLWSHKAFSVLLLGGIAFLVLRPGGGAAPAAGERQGASWAVFRGGPRRTGVVPGENGPRSAPHVLWKLAGDHLGPTSAVDSSPALVGNRIYFGVSNQSAFGSSGSIYAVDSDSGAVAWAWTGKGELAPPLRPVFASPAVWAEPPAPGAPPVARYVVSGEGYHEDQNCRILCLDLAPVQRSGGKEGPRLAWSVQTTSHVESSPCLDEGRVTIGCGDDGVWCVELATGRVLWRLEGCPFYEIADGPEAKALAGLEGKDVVVTGVVSREGLGAKGKDDPGVQVLDVKRFREHAGGPPVTASDSGAGFERVVTGRLVRPAAGRLRLEMAAHNPDSESPPVSVTTPEGRRLIFGAGLGGPQVSAVDADTGVPVWRTPTPFPAFGAPTIAGDKVLIGVGNGNFLSSDPNPKGAVLCLSLKDGRLLWSVEAADTIIGAVAIEGDKAYACSRDGHVYVLSLEGAILAKWPAGSPMVSSPAVSVDSVFVSTDAGRVLAFDRGAGTTRWTFPLSPGSPLFSSPSAGGGRVYVGTRSRGVFALAERPAEDLARLPARPWSGPGGDPSRSGCTDPLGLPVVGGEEADLKWPQPEAFRRPVTAPPAACGDRVYVPFEKALAQIDASTGRIRWELPLRATEILAHPDAVWVRDAKGDWGAFDPERGAPLSGRPRPAEGAALRAHDLEIAAEAASLVCRSVPGSRELWRAALDTPALTPATLSGDRIYVGCAGKDAAQGFLHCRRLVDGTPVWTQELDAAPLGHVAASAEWVAVATADDKVAAFKAADGKGKDPLLIGGQAVAPLIHRDTVVLAGAARVAAHDLSSSEWIWNYKDQDHIGKVAGPPLLCREVLWVGTEKRGLLAIGAPAGKGRP